MNSLATRIPKSHQRSDPIALAEAMTALAASPATAQANAAQLKGRVAALFTVDAMAETVDRAYRMVVAK